MNLRFEPVWIVGEGQLSLKLLTGFSFHSCGKTKLRVIQRNDITLLIIQSQSHTPNFSSAQISNTSSLILPVTSKPGCINKEKFPPASRTEWLPYLICGTSKAHQQFSGYK